MQRVIGLISGTSVDGIDAALLEISGLTDDLQINVLAGATYPYPADLRDRILAVCGGMPLSMQNLADLDDAIAEQFAAAALAIQAGYSIADLIGSHGQTVFHRPAQLPLRLGYSLQLGRGDAIAYLTGIPTISNFRTADIAVGGQGAPLVPPVDACLLSHPTLTRCVQNLGGIGNVTFLPPRPSSLPWPPDSILGWDTGPGNVLLDLAVYHLSEGTLTYDQDGAWAATGTPCQELVHQWLKQDFFHQPPPKSTGREWFGSAYLQRCLQDAAQLSLSPADILASLTDLTAASVAQNYRDFLPQMPDQVLLCGGGSQNQYLRQRIQHYLSDVAVLTTDQVGLSSAFKEAIAFAVLAYWRQQQIPGNLPAVTGAKIAVLLGEIFPYC